MCLCRRVKKQMKRREEGEEGEEERSNEGGISAKAAAWLCLNEKTSHSHFLLLSVCLYLWLLQTSTSRPNTEQRLSEWLQARSKYFSETVAEGAAFSIAFRKVSPSF